MSTTSAPNDLNSRLCRRMEDDRRQIEETAARELARLGENLSAVASGALRSIEADTAEATGRMRELLLKAWLRPLIVGVSLFRKCCPRRILLRACNLRVSVVRLPLIDSRWLGFQPRTLLRPSSAVLSCPASGRW